MGKKKSARRARLDNPDALHRDLKNGRTEMFECEGKKGCFVCGKVSSLAAPLRECAKCKEKGLKQVLYCSTNCQRVDWPEHKGFCGTEKENPSYWEDIGYTVRIPNACEDHVKLTNWTHVYRRVLIWATRQAYASKPDKKPPFNYASISVCPAKFRRHDTGAEHDFVCPGSLTFHAAPEHDQPKSIFPSAAMVVTGSTIDVDQVGICELQYFGAGIIPSAVVFFMAPLETCGQDIHFDPYKNITHEFCPQWPWIFYSLCTQASSNSHDLDVILDRLLSHVAKAKKTSESKLANFIVPTLSEKRFWIDGEMDWGRLMEPYELAYQREKKEENQRILDRVSLEFAMDSPAKARAIVKFLRSNPHDLSIRERVAASCTPQNWIFLVQQKYPDFLLEQANRCKEQALPPVSRKLLNNIYPDCFYHKPQLPEWFEPAHELGRALQVTRQISEAHGAQDEDVIHRIRHAVIQLLKIILSTQTGVGLPSLISQAQTRGWRDSEIEKKCVSNATFITLAMGTSLAHKPDPAMLKFFNMSGGMKIAMLCWYHSGDLHTRTLAVMALGQLFHELDSANVAMKSSLHLLSAEGIAERCADVLRDGLSTRPGCGEMRPIELALTLHLSCESMKDINGIPLGQFFVKTGLHRVVVEVTQQQLGLAVINWKIMHVSALILESLLYRSPEILTTLTEYIERLRILEILARVLLHDNFMDASEDDPWLKILKTIHHFVICKDVNCLWVGFDAYKVLVRRTLGQRGLWRNTAVKLIELCPKKRNRNADIDNARRRRLHVWTTLGMSLGLEDGQQFATITDSEGCHWKSCPGPRDGNKLSLFRCSACRCVSYCSKDCQTKDWKASHKHACKKM